LLSDLCAKQHFREATFARMTFVRSKLGEGKGTKLCEGEGSKLGEPCPKVRLSQDRLPIEPFAYFAQMSFAQMLLRANVTQPKL
jgi:hypothetical protein